MATQSTSVQNNLIRWQQWNPNHFRPQRYVFGPKTDKVIQLAIGIFFCYIFPYYSFLQKRLIENIFLNRCLVFGGAVGISNLLFRLFSSPRHPQNRQYRTYYHQQRTLVRQSTPPPINHSRRQGFSTPPPPGSNLQMPQEYQPTFSFNRPQRSNRNGSSSYHHTHIHFNSTNYSQYQRSQRPLNKRSSLVNRNITYNKNRGSSYPHPQHYQHSSNNQFNSDYPNITYNKNRKKERKRHNNFSFNDTNTININKNRGSSYSQYRPKNIVPFTQESKDDV